MHCVFLGVVKQLLGLWFNTKHSTQRWYCGNSVEKVDKRLLEIKPPSVITRVPRSIQHHLKFWKGIVFRLWCGLCRTFPKPYWKRLNFILGLPLAPNVVNLNSPWLWYQKLINKDRFFSRCFNTFTVVTISPLLCIEHRWREFVCWSWEVNG